MKVAIVHNKEAKTIEEKESLNAIKEQAGIQRYAHEPQLVNSDCRAGALLTTKHH